MKKLKLYLDTSVISYQPLRLFGFVEFQAFSQRSDGRRSKMGQRHKPL